MKFNPLLACLSVEYLNTSYVIAYAMAAISTVVVLASLAIEWRRKKFSWLILYAPLLILQPAWRLAWNEIHRGWRAASADCGFGNRGESIFLMLTFVVIFVAILRGNVTKRLFLLRLTVVCSIIYGVIFVLSYTPFPFAVLSSVLSPEVAGPVWGTMAGGAWRLSSYIIVFSVICLALYLNGRFRIQEESEDGGS